MILESSYQPFLLRHLLSQTINLCNEFLSFLIELVQLLFQMEILEILQLVQGVFCLLEILLEADNLLGLKRILVAQRRDEILQLLLL